jgi:AcrR family transcriptional regulator
MRYRSIMASNATDAGQASRAYADAMAGAEHVQRRPTPAAAFARARQQFRAGQRLDMAALAAELGIARGTLYRWTGDRDRLLADLCIADLDELIHYLDTTVKATGVARLEQMADAFLTGLAGNGALQRFLEQEGDHGLRLVTDPKGRVRPHLVEVVAGYIEREQHEGRYRAPADPRVLADGIVAMCERFLYHNGAPELNPDPATARVVIGLLLREN